MVFPLFDLVGGFLRQSQKRSDEFLMLKPAVVQAQVDLRHDLVGGRSDGHADEQQRHDQRPKLPCSHKALHAWYRLSQFKLERTS